VAGDQRLRRAPEQVVGILAVAPAQLEYVAEPAGDEQADGRAPALQQRVEADRGAVHERLRAGQRVRRERFPDRPQHALVGRLGREQLAHHDRAAVRRVGDQVRERAADVDADPHPSHRAGCFCISAGQPMVGSHRHALRFVR
jgi:hypothetical protein